MNAPLPYARALRLDGAMSPAELAFLYDVARSMPEDALVVEVGSFKGRSSVAICEGLSQVPGARFVAVDPWRRIRMTDSELYEPGAPDEDEIYRRFVRNTGPYDFVKPMRMTSLEAAPEFADASVDWLFVDGDHSFDAVRADLRAWYPKVKLLGLVSGHDHTWFDVRWAVASHARSVSVWDSIWHFRKTRPSLGTRPLPLLVGTARKALRRAPAVERGVRALRAR
ncbi:MAG: hypothetical protein QOI98_252 [Solirubrobacteraceae bacterium]|nr:hypothetical protein [Solirubrobacteraceae bacterium]